MLPEFCSVGDVSNNKILVDNPFFILYHWLKFHFQERSMTMDNRWNACIYGFAYGYYYYSRPFVVPEMEA